MKNNIIIFIVTILLFICTYAILTASNNEEKEIILQPTYSIYEYNYENVIVFRYMEHKVIYEYAPEGIHLIQLIKGTEQITILEFGTQEQSVDFAYAYLEDIQREDRL